MRNSISAMIVHLILQKSSVQNVISSTTILQGEIIISSND